MTISSNRSSAPRNLSMAQAIMVAVAATALTMTVNKMVKRFKPLTLAEKGQILREQSEALINADPSRPISIEDVDKIVRNFKKNR